MDRFRSLAILVALTALLATATPQPASAQSLGPGAQFPMDTVFEGLYGDAITLQPGSYVLLDFWAQWCGPCRDKMTHELKPLAGEGRNLQIISVSVGGQSTPEQERAFVESNGLTWDFAHGPTGESLSRQFGVRGIPYLVLISPQGQVMDAGNGSGPIDMARSATGGGGNDGFGAGYPGGYPGGGYPGGGYPAPGGGAGPTLTGFPNFSFTWMLIFGAVVFAAVLVVSLLTRNRGTGLDGNA
jgi:thiol-disulfide isomerase/thioredoxin